ncbi:hypothetical protein RFI_36902 [Reticulomyxa filosa]|uniref:Uncharacterized protein n=1 Tax=Reticulomyxa filosa TaxID=46433 RepID=X6LHD6_RETFI|nr:hypothetical protein RFI_36902 [Reticulomyxa filosa]|eukprot:ETO00537.1 hypothetical protein RFI_36902 [Reticulomyxa filosa]
MNNQGLSRELKLFNILSSATDVKYWTYLLTRDYVQQSWNQLPQVDQLASDKQFQYISNLKIELVSRVIIKNNKDNMSQFMEMYQSFDEQMHILWRIPSWHEILPLLEFKTENAYHQHQNNQERHVKEQISTKHEGQQLHLKVYVIFYHIFSCCEIRKEKERSKTADQWYRDIWIISRNILTINRARIVNLSREAKDNVNKGNRHNKSVSRRL